MATRRITIPMTEKATQLQRAAGRVPSTHMMLFLNAPSALQQRVMAEGFEPDQVDRDRFSAAEAKRERKRARRRRNDAS